MSLMRCLAVLSGLIGSIAPVHAHHSFAVHYVPDKIISISGVVSDFRFTNPHGIVVLKVKNKAGAEEEWIAATNSPNMLRRTGWSKDSLKAGETVTIEGFPMRDGSNGMRIHRVIFSDGRELLGQRRVPGNSVLVDEE